MNIWDILILILLAAAVYAAMRHIRKNKGSCGSSCCGCPHENGCEKKKE